MAQWTEQLKDFIPWVAFIAGLGGSLHCVGMCGGLVSASCHNQRDVFRYQFGRLLGYLFLGTIGGYLGSLITFKNAHPLWALIPSIFVGGLFIFWGIQSYLGKKSLRFGGKFFNSFYKRMWSLLIVNNNNFSRSFFVGLISILLPCGFLYGVLLGTLATQNVLGATIGMFFFWLGTLPSMLLAPSIIHKVLRPLQSQKPKIYAVSLILIGLTTISVRAKNQFEMQAHKHTDQIEQEAAPSCH